MRVHGRVAIVVGLVLAGVFAGSALAGEKAKGAKSWRLGMQAYSFNRFTFFEAIDKNQSLGLHVIEAYPGQKLSKERPEQKFHHDMPAEARAYVQKKLDAAKVKLVCYGVVGLGTDEAANRKVFDFAKAMGIETIVSEPDPKAFDLLDKLTAEYKINVAIHNHPKPSRYWSPDIVLEAIKGHSKRIGVCADTGHWMRSGIKPIDALKKLEGRIISSHLKDLGAFERKAHDVPWGTGKADIRGVLKELRRQKFTGVFSIEYEHNWDNSVPDIAKCVKFFHKVEKELDAAK